MDATVNEIKTAIDGMYQLAERLPAMMAALPQDHQFTDAEKRELRDLFLRTQSRVPAALGVVFDALRPEQHQVRYRVVERHPTCGHSTPSEDVWREVGEQPPENVEAPEVREFSGRAYCPDCWATRNAQGGIKAPTAEELEAIRLYREYSEACWAAGWMADPPQQVEEFVQYLSSRTASESDHAPQGYELEHAALLVEAVRTAHARAEAPA